MPIYYFRNQNDEVIEEWYSVSNCPLSVERDGIRYEKTLAPVSFLIPEHMRATQDIESIRKHNELAARELANNPKAEITSKVSREAQVDLDNRITKHRQIGTAPEKWHDF